MPRLHFQFSTSAAKLEEKLRPLPFVRQHRQQRDSPIMCKFVLDTGLSARIARHWDHGFVTDLQGNR
jgi:hypothetical protein